MAAVAVWAHLPTADELLDARVARGWEPTPTAVRGGEEVLGHAARLVPRGPSAAR